LAKAAVSSWMVACGSIRRSLRQFLISLREFLISF